MSLLTDSSSFFIGIMTTPVFYDAFLHLTRRKGGKSYKFRIIRDVLARN